MAIQNAVQRVHFGYSADDTHDRRYDSTVLDAVDLIRGVEVNQVAMVRARFGRMFQGIIRFAAGSAVAAILFYIAGFWCLAMPVAIGATTAIL